MRAVAASFLVCFTALMALGAAAQAPGAVRKATHIQPQALRPALHLLSKEHDFQLVFRTDVVADMQTGGARGELTIEEALQQLLSGTGLTYRYLDERTITIVGPVGPVHPAASGGSSSATGAATEASGPGSASLRLARAGADEQPAAANDQSGVRPASPARDGAPVQEIVVTAQRRAERLLDAPVSLSVISAQDIERRGLVSREDYLRTVPAVSVRDDGVGLAEIVIRGAYGDSFRTGPTVGLYFGDVPLSGYAIGGSADVKLIDMRRIEVLRGPQGTLYGSNALSGAVRYLPVEPDLRDFSASVLLGYSNTAHHGGSNNAVDGILNLPLVTDQLALRAVAFRHYEAGYVRNTAGDDATLQAAAAAAGASALAVNKEHVGSAEYSGGRVSLLWQPTAALGINLTYVDQKDAQDDRLFELRQAGPFSRSDYQLAGIIGGSEEALRIDLDIVNLTAQYDLGWASLYTSNAWMDQRFIRKWDIGALTGIFGTPVKPIPQISTTDAEITVHELRLTSALAGPLQFVAGLYYEDSAQPTTQRTFFGGDPAANPFAAVKLWQINLERDVTQRAAYGEVSYQLFERLKATVGGRHFDYDSRFRTFTFDSVIALVPPSDSNTSAGESGQTYKAGVEFKASSDALLYATWSQGFRLGRPIATEFIRAVCDLDRDGFLDGTNIPSTLNQIDSDGLDSYELGAKLRLLGGRAVVTTALYQNDWSDIPITFRPPGCATSTSINGGSARARGFEGEASLRLLDGLALTLGIGYVDSELSATTSLGQKGDELNFTPKLNGNLGLEFGFSIAQREAFLRTDYTYFGSYYTQTGQRGARADGYSLVNLRAGLKVTRGAELLLHVDNVLDADDLTTVAGPGGFPAGYQVRLRPRTVGVGLNYRF